MLVSAETELAHRRLVMLQALAAALQVESRQGRPDRAQETTRTLDQVDELWWGQSASPAKSPPPSRSSRQRSQQPASPPSQQQQQQPPTPLPASRTAEAQTPFATPALPRRGPLTPASATPGRPRGPAEPLQHSIAGLPVENWDRYRGTPRLDGCDLEADERLNAALGLLCLMSIHAAKYLDVPVLRPMVFRGSASLVADPEGDPAELARLAERRRLVHHPGQHWAPEETTGEGIPLLPLEHGPAQPSEELLVRAITLLNANVRQLLAECGLGSRGSPSNPATVIESLALLAGAAKRHLLGTRHSSS